MTTTTHLAISGPFDLCEIALMGFGHRDERSFDGVMRMGFCLDGYFERRVGVAARQSGDRLQLLAKTIGDPLNDAEIEAVRKQLARVVSLDHDGEAFHQLCLANPVRSRVHTRAPGFRPAYGIDHELSDAELLGLAETWRPFRTWVSVMMRALSS